MKLGDLPEEPNRGIIITSNESAIVEEAKRVAMMGGRKILVTPSLLACALSSAQDTSVQPRMKDSTAIMPIYNFEDISSGDLKSGKEKRRERRAKERKNKKK